VPKPTSRSSHGTKARGGIRRRATLAICGPDSRRPGGRLFDALCELSDRFLERRGDPCATRLGTVLFYVAFHSARAAADDDFRLSLRSSLAMLIELEPLEPIEPLRSVEPRERWLPAPPRHDPLPGQPTPVPYPFFAGDDLAFSRRST
jgi:hypothetical protein